MQRIIRLLRTKKPVFTRKKKLLELYLYAQGLLFAQQSDTLRHPAAKARFYFQHFILPCHKYRS
jgi:hypothetical protein